MDTTTFPHHCHFLSLLNSVKLWNILALGLEVLLQFARLFKLSVLIFNCVYFLVNFAFEAKLLFTSHFSTYCCYEEGVSLLHTACQYQAHCYWRLA